MMDDDSRIIQERVNSWDTVYVHIYIYIYIFSVVEDTAYQYIC